MSEDAAPEEALHRSLDGRGQVNARRLHGLDEWAAENTDYLMQVGLLGSALRVVHGGEVEQTLCQDKVYGCNTGVVSAAVRISEPARKPDRR